MADTERLHAALADRYRIERELGAGGMATVYLARDLKYDRPIALKVLRPELAAVLGAERFLNEIRVTARLEHPHIVTLIDSGESGGLLWYVLPYVRGESLREKLTREKQLGMEEALQITTDVASALDYAHGEGVVHRDIKPENILLHEGEAMLADFGIALAVREAGGNRLTETGLSLGTPQYMSPEQATGDRTLDARSDVYSLGAVLYEMLAGEPPVTGPTVQAVIAKLLTERPTSMRTVRDTVPKAVDDAVAKALAKVPADRFASAGAFARALGAAQPRTVAGQGGPGRRRWLPAAVVLGVVAALGAGWLAVHALRPKGPDLAVRDRVQATFTGAATGPAISADGKQLAYVVRRCAAATCAYGVEVQDIGGSASRRVFDGATALYRLQWSPDRRFLMLDGTIGDRYGSWVVSTLGGAPRYVGSGLATFFPSGDSLLLASPPTDRVPRLWVTTLDGDRHDSVAVGGAGERVWYAAVLPGGRWIVAAFTTAEGGGDVRLLDRQGQRRDVHVFSTSTGAIKTQVSADAIWFQFAQSGSAQTALARLAVDRARGRFADRVDTVLLLSSHEAVDVASDGRAVAYVEGAAQYGLWALETAAALRGHFAPERQLASTTSANAFSMAPDGGHVLLTRPVAGAGGGRTALAIVPFGGGSEVTLAAVDAPIGFGWMPDGAAVLYGERAGGRVHLVTLDARSGARRSVFAVPDSGIGDVTPLGNAGWAWIGASEAGVRIQRLGAAAPLDLPRPQAVTMLWGLSGSPDGSRLALLGRDAANDSLYVFVYTLQDQRATRWATLWGEDALVRWLDDGSLLVAMWPTQETVTLARVRGPGRLERLGTIPRPVEWISASRDGRRLALRTRDFRGDVWLAHLGPAR